MEFLIDLEILLIPEPFVKIVGSADSSCLPSRKIQIYKFEILTSAGASVTLRLYMDDIFMSEEVCETEEYDGRCSKGDASSSSAVAEARPFLLFVATARKTKFG